ncbi:MAG: Tol-Pal system subunit TolQ [Deltaproteobacteria bacterium CG_4_10_14_0_2_um_filter_43_8]|nr:MAG: Tol-Pal system subunit TolQ [Deltaproteobacteria bacterium CG11_big_fil_rev_8_21_14_0_20_42_23]PJA21468.1 MAG: Tol-Pal system subunit TolQ [Deltaproteobacteria bacterium CG_4_10_14_0_2_um_filter_43_8]PJC63377.1 MAG: Tol-Pal system subunit TolQ [Deltaproteobacteria bacterium CG_4_9_14_0_2_um_filter_42_21]
MLSTLALLAQTAQTEATEAVQQVSQNHSILALMWNANIVVKLTLLLLIIFSIVCWAIIGSKYKQIKRYQSSSKDFFKLFWDAPSIADLIEKKKFNRSPAFSIFKSGVDSLREHKNDGFMIERDIKQSLEEQIETMEYGVPFLATTASAAPFIGLFGTVWGILQAFWEIGKTGASSLAIVGPYIAEALIATAIGLAAAIPAAIFYNFYSNRIRLMTKRLEDFSVAFLNRMNKEYFS